MNVMVVDDAVTARMKIKALLKELGYQHIVIASDAQEALQSLTQLESLELMFVDWNMPGISGLELIQRLRALPAYEQTKIVMVTSETGMLNIVAALEAGANEYMMKPFNKTILMEKLQILGLADS